MRSILACNKRVHVRDMLEALHFMSVKERTECNVCLLVYKMLNDMCPSYLYNKCELTQRDSTINTKQEGNVYIEKCRSRGEQRILLCDGVKM